MKLYSLQEREQLRQALVSYMQEHRIGAPALAKDIENSLSRNRSVPTSTLQGFIKEAHNTNALAVSFIAEFISFVAKDDLPRLGLALSAFYVSNTKADELGQFAAVEQVSSVDTYKSTIEVIPHQGAWHVKETSDSDGSMLQYDGVLASRDSIWIMVLKDRLLGLPRTITLRSIAGFMEGSVIAAHIPDNTSTSALFDAVQIRQATIRLERSSS